MRIKKTILVVDDNKILSETIQRYFEEYGHTVSSCQNGFDALKLLKERTFDLIFTDYNMPKMNGAALCRLLRQDYPLTLIVGFSSEYRKKDFLDAGADAFVLKDELFHDPDLLLAKIRPSS
jgi:CheY-like chemotaxis protein